MKARNWPILASMIMPLAACGTGTVAPSTGVRPVQIAPPPNPYTKASPLTGLDARNLIQQFGTPRLDIQEPTVRKLQFGNGRCILDAYLYPPAIGRDPIVTYIEARSPTGADVDANACVGTLRGK